MSNPSHVPSGVSAEARAWILGRLREGLADPLAAFKVPGPPDSREGPPTPITHADGDRRALAERFGSSLDAVLGSHERVESAHDAVERVAAHVQALRETGSAEGLTFARALSWSPDALGVPGLGERLARDGVELSVPDDLQDPAERQEAAGIAVGITSVDAALASTGTLVMGADAGRSRAASLLPLHHIVLVPTSRIHATAESWIASLRADGRLDETLRDGSQLTFVTGPSKSADIELTLTLGVHGPRTVHAVVYHD
jgi:L-lactate dehydrogenase complex protein LldG